MNDILRTIKVVTLGLLITLGVNYLHAWTGPTEAPPSGNVPAPVNVGAALQTKTGGLWTSFLGSSGGLYVAQNLGIGSGAQIPAAKLDVDGTIRIRGGSPAAGKVLVSDAEGDGSWSSLMGSSFAFKRSAIQSKDSVVWCPATHPYIISCTVVDDKAPAATTLADLGAAGCGTSDGACDQTGDRDNLGTDDVYLETVEKTGPVYGCLAYDRGHAHMSYRLDLICAK
jgi:hypothetical protein